MWTCMQNSLWRQIGNRPMPLTSSVMRQSVSNFMLYCCSKKFQMLRKNVKSLLEQLQVYIFAEILFGVRCTLIGKLCFSALIHSALLLIGTILNLYRPSKSYLKPVNEKRSWRHRNWVFAFEVCETKMQGFWLTL